MEQLKIIVDENGMVNVWKDGIKQEYIKSIDFHADTKNDNNMNCTLNIEQDLMDRRNDLKLSLNILSTPFDLEYGIAHPKYGHQANWCKFVTDTDKEKKKRKKQK